MNNYICHGVVSNPVCLGKTLEY